MAEGKTPTEKINKDLEKAITEFKKANELNTRLANNIKKQSVEIQKGKAVKATQQGVLKQFISKKSPILDKTFKFLEQRRSGREGGKLRSVINAKTLAPALIKGLSLGLLKFGVPGAIAAAKMIDLTDDFQEFRKDTESTARETNIELVEQLVKNENKSTDEVKRVLKDNGLKSRDIALVLEGYQDRLDDGLKESIQSGIEAGQTNKEILSEITGQNLEMSNMASDTKAIVEQATDNSDKVIDSNDDLLGEQKNTTEELRVLSLIEQQRLAFEKQVEQNNELRFIKEMDAKREIEEPDGGGGFFSSLLGSMFGVGGPGAMMGGFKKSLLRLTPLLAGLGTVAAAAGVAFAAFKIGGKINEGINSLVETFTGEEGATAGGKFFDVIDGATKRMKDFFGVGEKAEDVLSERALAQARERGFTGTSGEDIRKFIEAERKQRLEMIKEEPKSAEIETLKTEIKNKQRLDDERKRSEDRAFQEKLIQESGEQTRQQIMVIDTNKRLDKIPANTDELPLAFMAKGGIQ